MNSKGGGFFSPSKIKDFKGIPLNQRNGIMLAVFYNVGWCLIGGHSVVGVMSTLVLLPILIWLSQLKGSPIIMKPFLKPQTACTYNGDVIEDHAELGGSLGELLANLL